MTRVHYLRLTNFKGFEDFRVNFGGYSVLVGPNNAGKSTILEGLRASARMLRIARARRPQQMRSHRAGLFPAHPLSPALLSQAENLRYEFRQVETSLELGLERRHVLRAIWPSDDSGESPFFYVSAPNGVPIRKLKYIRENFPAPYVIPVLGPIETYEPVLSDDYVTQSRSTRLATRHFRNHLRILSNDWDEEGVPRLQHFYKFAHEWLPAEVRLEQPRIRRADRTSEIDVFYREGRVPKEIAWAGDGIQVFLQLLLHVFLAESAGTLVLDEPDVFLHPDLQRRVVRLLEATDQQIILATHSPEVVLESPPAAVTWVDRSRRRAVRAPGSAVLDDLREALGSGVSLRLAQVLRREAVVIVEGDDAKILRIIGRSVGRKRLMLESSGLGVLKLEGLNNWPKLEGFSWLADRLLEGAVTALVLLDRDVRSDREVSSVIAALQQAGLRCHVWARHELENYLLHPSLLSRLTGVPEAEIESMIDSACDELKTETIAAGVKYWSEYRPERRKDIKTVATEVVGHVESSWDTRDARMRIVSGKDLLRSLNQRLQTAGQNAVTPMSLATHLQVDEIDPELLAILDEIEKL